jgi:hypothetical protein
MKVRSGKEVIDAIKLAYAAGKPVLLEGKHGVGKSNLIEQAAKELGIDCIVRDLSLMEPPDLIGLPAQQNGRTCYLPPSFLPDSGKGLLVFEELNRSERYMMAPCLQLLTARTLNDYKLPPGWLCVAAINPSSDGYDTQELDPALLSRFVRIEVVADAKTWTAWGKDAGVHAAVLKFVSQTPDIFAATESNPRSWCYVSDVLKTYERQKQTDDNLLVVTLAGLIGESLAVAFVQASLREEESIPADSILKEYEKARSMIQHWMRSKQVDLLNATAHNVMIALQNMDTASSVATMATPGRNLETFISDLPADIGKKVRKAAKQAGALK